MATLSTSGSASLLLEIVQKTVEDGIEKKDTTFNRIEKATPPQETNTLGFRMPILVEDNASESWRSTEGADFPISGTPVWKNLTVTYTRVYRTCEFTADVAQLDKQPSKITSIIAAATANATARQKKSLNQMAFGEASGEVGRYSSGTGTTTITFTSTSGNFFGSTKIVKNGRYQWWDSTLATQRNNGYVFTVSSVDRANKQAVFDVAPTLSANDVLVNEGSVSASINGLGNIIGNTGTIFGLSRTTYPALNNSVIAASNAMLSQSLMDQMDNQMAFKTGIERQEDMILTWSPVQKQAYLNLGYDLKQFIQPGAQTLDLGFEGVTHSNRNVIVDVDCPDDSIFFANYSKLGRYELLPLGPVKTEGGGIMFQKNAASGSGHADSYMLYLAGKLQLASSNPKDVGSKLTGLGLPGGVSRHIS